jgi:hypothetical protein
MQMDGSLVLERGRSWTFFNAIFKWGGGRQRARPAVCNIRSKLGRIGRIIRPKKLPRSGKGRIRPKIIRPDPVVIIIHPRLLLSTRVGNAPAQQCVIFALN